jgi:hemin uptake protein HemP
MKRSPPDPLLAIAQAGTRSTARAERPRPGSERRLIPSSELFAADSAELEIEHNGEIYCLRRTSKGKLILTK